MAQLVATASPAPPPKFPHVTLLVFDNSDEQAVLDAMKRELTPARGFQPRDTIHGPNHQIQFTKVGTGPPSPSPEEGGYFEYGPEAKEFLDAVVEHRSLNFKKMSDNGPAVCTVALLRKETWFDRQLAVVRRFLHL
jgi:hypothetical protein